MSDTTVTEPPAEDTTPEAPPPKDEKCRAVEQHWVAPEADNAGFQGLLRCAAVRPPFQSFLLGPSTVFCVAV